MDDEELIKLAKQCYLPWDQQTGEVLNYKNLVMFTKIIRFRERERIAKKIEKLPFGDTAQSFAVWVREQDV